MTKHTPSTCTYVYSTGACGKHAVWSDGTYAECAEHAAQHGSLATGPRATVAAYAVGDTVAVERHGKTYAATVVKVGARGAVYAEVVYGNGATRTVRVQVAVKP